MHGEDGSTAVEAILALTMLTPLLFGIVAFGDALQRWIGQDAATAQAARLAGEVGGDAIEVRALLADGLRDAGIDPRGAEVVIAPARVGWREPVAVSVTTHHRLAIPFVPAFDLALRSEFVSRGEVNR
ncbi:MAG TPA: TadE/TadG family type IV pilus assembly protein [Candidatus Dormibacteraeota bacterium]|jgi:hypothetical protein|nr:TadE/TadG family type IV pilus assembly protein [Candidatus Dormibacteraeota bacterium]